MLLLEIKNTKLVKLFVSWNYLYGKVFEKRMKNIYIILNYIHFYVYKLLKMYTNFEFQICRTSAFSILIHTAQKSPKKCTLASRTMRSLPQRLKNNIYDMYFFQWSEEKISKNVDFSLWGNIVEVNHPCTHLLLLELYYIAKL